MELGLNFGAGGYKDDAPDGASDRGSSAQVTASPKGVRLSYELLTASQFSRLTQVDCDAKTAEERSPGRTGREAK
jgi:hypothetical protein